MTADTWAIVVANLLLVGITAAYVVLTAKILQEQRQLTRHLRQPCVEAILRQSTEAYFVMTLIVRNTSAVPAHDIRLNLEPAWVDSLGLGNLKPTQMRLFTHPIPVLAGGEQEWSELLDMRPLDQVPGSDKTIRISARYSAFDGREYESRFTYDLRLYGSLVKLGAPSGGLPSRG